MYDERFPYTSELAMPVIGLEAEFKVFVDDQERTPEEVWRRPASFIDRPLVMRIKKQHVAATLATERVYEGFLAGPGEPSKTFFHGHTYTGNPLACAAALATLELFERERTLEELAPKIQLLSGLLEELVSPLAWPLPSGP